jgi:hypothetical protein
MICRKLLPLAEPPEMLSVLKRILNAEECDATGAEKQF